MARRWFSTLGPSMGQNNIICSHGAEGGDRENIHIFTISINLRFMIPRHLNRYKSRLHC